MAEDDQILNRMEYHTYKILKEQNDQLQAQITNNTNIISTLRSDLDKEQTICAESIQNLENQNQEMKQREDEIKNIRIRDETQVFQLKDQLTKFKQRYNQQEKINEFQLCQQINREPNHFFYDISKDNDGNFYLKIIFDTKFNIKKLDGYIRENTMNIVAILEFQELSHIIQKQIQLDSIPRKCLAKIVQKNEVTFQIGIDV